MRTHKKSQHYVPRLHLRRFTMDGSDNRVYCFDKPDRRSYPNKIGNIGMENFFYDPKDNDPETENFLEQIESEAGIAYQKIEDNEGLECLTDHDRAMFALYIAIQDLRTREQRNAQKSRMQQLRERLADEPLSPSLKAELSVLEDREASAREIQIELLKERGGEFAELIGEFRWTLLINDTQTPLWTSDDPICRHNLLNQDSYGSLGLLSSGINLYFPLSPRLLLLLSDPTSYGFLGTRHRLTDPRTVTFHNDLQVTQSNRHLFSNEEDFSQARKRLDKNPELGDTDRKRSEMNPWEEKGGT